MGNYRGVVQGSVQTAYFDQPLDGYPGQIATPNDPLLIDGFPVNFAAGIGVGLGVIADVNLSIPANDYGNIPAPYNVRPPTTGDVFANFVGVSVRDSAMPNSNAGVPTWEDNLMMPVLRAGRIFVQTNEAVTAGAAVRMYISDTDAHGAPLGSFRTSASTTVGDSIAITNAVFYRAAAAGLAIIEIRAANLAVV
jgi:hypothetical protein